MKMNKRKGQAEVFGLIVIVIMLIFLFLFYVKIKQDDTTTVNLRSNYRANNLLNAIVNLKFEDDNHNIIDMKKMLKTCAERNGVYCTGGSDNVIIGVNTYLEQIFSNTLSNEKHEFKIFYGGTEKYISSASECVEGITASPIILPGNYKFTLKLCY